MLQLHTFITWALIGLIWHVQIVQYPLFLEVGHEAFSRYHAGHCLRISFVVGPLMLLEVATAAWLLWSGERDVFFLGSLALIAVIWLATALVQVPIHNELTVKGWSAELIQKLVLTNWVRTVAWSVRGLIVGWMCLR